MPRIKSRFGAQLRRVGLLSLTDRLTFVANLGLHYRANRAFLSSHPEFHIPPRFDVYDMYGRIDWSRYDRSGAEVAEYMARAIHEHLPEPPAAVLEWGCGTARVLQHLPKLVAPAAVYGCDYNARAIEWDRANIPLVDFRRNDLDPPLPFHSGALDAVYAHSVLTHLSERLHFAWRDELLRVLRPGGLLILTVNGETMSRRALLDHEYAGFARGEYVGRTGVPEGKKYYAAYHPPQFMRRLLEPLEILAHDVDHEKSTMNQDIWIARRPVA